MKLATIIALTLVHSGCQSGSRVHTDYLQPQKNSYTNSQTHSALFSKPELTEGEALEIGKRFAEEKKWQLRYAPKNANFFGGKGEWQMFFGVGAYGGPFIVYVNDRTKATRFVKGE